jgi:hypothetical protein
MGKHEINHCLVDLETSHIPSYMSGLTLTYLYVPLWFGENHYYLYIPCQDFQLIHNPDINTKRHKDVKDIKVISYEQ